MITSALFRCKRRGVVNPTVAARHLITSDSQNCVLLSFPPQRLGSLHKEGNTPELAYIAPFPASVVAHFLQIFYGVVTGIVLVIMLVCAAVPFLCHCYCCQRQGGPNRPMPSYRRQISSVVGGRVVFALWGMRKNTSQS